MTSRRSVLLALLVDAALVVVFAAIGRATHDGDVLGPAGSGLATTAWPFLVGLLLGWAVSIGWRRPLAPLRTGLPVWAVTLVVGMLLRALSGQGIAVAFIIVAGITLLLFLVGWRAIAALVARPRVSRSV
ncbi:DUF3054 domain-containing protein [Microbacterium enclense]|uniref:DUF3054 domain-containing protein n=1 Tax=Microbacterium enclense TaxID=993073 RepID=A0A443JRZ2_9MICO|nr:DUF3054 domain-containing protein [Microbacterium enclense]RWR23274.1 DUF3054 domain-containing protein [Microbacterium enclense]